MSGSLGELRLVLIHWCSKMFDLTSSESKVVKMFIFASKVIATRSCWPTYGLSIYEVRKPVASFEEKWSIIETKRGILSLQGECHLFQPMFPSTLMAGGRVRPLEQGTADLHMSSGLCCSGNASNGAVTTSCCKPIFCPLWQIVSHGALFHIWLFLNTHPELYCIVCLWQMKPLWSL